MNATVGKEQRPEEKRLIEDGVRAGYVKIDEDSDGNNEYITYIHQNKRRNLTKPEEWVQALSFLKLVIDYGYKPEQTKLLETVTIGSNKGQADIIVYDEKGSARIVVECKKEDASELEFKQAISQAFSYAATGTVRAKYFWVTSRIKNAYFEIPEEEPKKYFSVPDIPQSGVTNLARYKYAKGGGLENGQKLFPLAQVTESELTRRFKQAHNALWGGGELNPSDAFDELDKLIFCKIWDERKGRKKGEPYDFQIFQESTDAKTVESLHRRIKALYEEGRKKDPEVFKDDIRLSPEKLRTVVGYLESISLSQTDLDSKGRAFETFLGSFFRGDFGQYFTPRPIVKFIVDVLPINNNSLVLDTSCGSGGFLLHALEKVRRQADEYHDDGSVEHYRYWHNFAEHNLYGIEISEQISRTAKMNMIIHDDGHSNIIACDGLLPIDDVVDDEGVVRQQGVWSKTRHPGFKYNRFDFILTNPPFGSTIRQTEQAYMENYGYALKDVEWLNPKSKKSERENQSTEVLFIEQAHNYLKKGGYLAIVIPDGILTNSTLQYVRDGIEERYRIIAVVSMPSTAFQATGAGVKSSVLFLKKYSDDNTSKIKNLKSQLQEKIKEREGYIQQLETLEKNKKEEIDGLVGFNAGEDIIDADIKEIKKSDAYKQWKKNINEKYNDKVVELKIRLLDLYSSEKSDLLHDYPIFMAIAEDIGYDAAGRETGNNELEMIGAELKRFIDAIEKEQS